MTDFATIADVNAAILAAPTLGNTQFPMKANVTTVSGYYYSVWSGTGFPAASSTGTIPTTAAVCNRSTTGALFRWNPVSGKTSRLLAFGYEQYSATIQCVYYDRLCHMGGLSTIVLTAQTVNLDLTSVAADGRCAANGSDVEWFLECFAAGSATTCTFTVSYTNQDGTSGKTSIAITIPASGWPIGRLYPINLLAAGDTSIRSIQSVTLSAGTTTAGNFGVVAAKRLFQPETSRAGIAKINNAASLQARANGTLDALSLGMPKLPNNACIWPVLYSGSTASGNHCISALIGVR